MTVLKEIPFVLPFEERVLVFQDLLLHNKMEYQADAQFMVGSSIHITVRRDYLYEDAFEKLSIENGKCFSISFNNYYFLIQFLCITHRA